MVGPGCPAEPVGAVGPRGAVAADGATGPMWAAVTMRQREAQPWRPWASSVTRPLWPGLDPGLGLAPIPAAAPGPGLDPGADPGLDPWPGPDLGPNPELGLASGRNAGPGARRESGSASNRSVSSTPRIGFRPASEHASACLNAPNKPSRSVSARAGMPSSAARATRAAGLAVPYRSEYDDATCRWVNSPTPHPARQPPPLNSRPPAQRAASPGNQARRLVRVLSIFALALVPARAWQGPAPRGRQRRPSRRTRPPRHSSRPFSGRKLRL
jgi:hypothetical protein